MMYKWMSCKILLLIIILFLITQQSQKETFINLNKLNIFEKSTINYNKCRRKFRIGFKNQYSKIKNKFLK